MEFRGRITSMKSSQIFKRIIITASVAVVALFSGVLPSATASAACLSKDPDNDIMHCGTTGRSDFIAKTRANSPGDLKTIYAYYGLDESEYDRFASNARSGKSLPNGDIKVDGKVVATGGHSLGRKAKTKSSPVVIGSITYHESALGDVTKYENDVLVLFDSDNRVEFVVMNICGNPIRIDQPEQPAPKPDPTPTPEKPKKPKIDVQKTVGDNYDKTISANEGDEFSYRIVVKNTGDAKLTQIKLFDKPSTRITLLEVPEGEIKDNTWTHTIDSLAPGEEIEYIVRAKLTGYNSFSQTNRVCVDAKEISGEDDDCDSAQVKPTKQVLKATTQKDDTTPVKKGEESAAVTEVPKTGPAETLGAVLGLGSLAGAGYYWRTGRREFLKNALNQ